MKSFIPALLVTILFSSCYTYTYTVGQGPQKGEETREHNHYFIYGLAPGNISDPIEMAGDTKNYEVTILHTFVDGLLGSLTFGIYTPTTTIVNK